MSQPIMTNEEVITSFPRYQGPAAPGFIIDFLGMRTRTVYLKHLPPEGGIVEDYPLPPGIGNFHATTLEWAGVLRTVLDAAAQAAQELVVVELGAGWAPWLVAVTYAARMKGITQFQLIGVEGSKEHCDYMYDHFRDNGLDPHKYSLIHGVAGASDGIAEFPLLPDAAIDWGYSAIYPEDDNQKAGRLSLQSISTRLRNMRRKPVRPPIPTERVQCISIPTLIHKYTQVNLIHIDIQGAEYDIVMSARQVLKEKVKRLVIGTHGRTIEEKLIDTLPSQGWLLEDEEACRFLQEGQKISMYRDGCQVWRNLAFE